MKNVITYGFLLLCAMFSHAQQDEKKDEKDTFLPDGNAAFKKKEYAKAEADYRISQSKFPKKAIASYNLGNSIYASKHRLEAKFAYSNAIKNATTRPEKHKAYHNLGNVFMEEKNYSQAVEMFRQALINKPSDEETRYNYALAKKMLKDNPPPPPKNDKNKDKDKQDKKEDKGGDDDKKDNEQKNDKDKDNKDDKGNQQQNPGGNQPQPKPQPKPGQGGISGQRIENLLEAVNNEEKKVQEKMKSTKVKGKPVQTEKDW